MGLMTLSLHSGGREMNIDTKLASSLFPYELNLRPQSTDGMTHIQNASSFFSWMFLKMSLEVCPKVCLLSNFKFCNKE